MSDQLKTLLRRGLSAHEGNRADEAEEIYRQVLDIAPGNPEALAGLVPIRQRGAIMPSRLKVPDSLKRRLISSNRPLAITVISPPPFIIWPVWNYRVAILASQLIFWGGCWGFSQIILKGFFCLARRYMRLVRRKRR